MQQYMVNLRGITPLIMHRDNLAFLEKIAAWRKDPANRELSTKAGDDRVPPWSWLGFAYHNGREFGIPADNLMTMLREGASKVNTSKARETYKRQASAGIIIDAEQWPILVNGRTVQVAAFQPLIGNLDFNAHIEAAEAAGFELLIKRAKIGMAKHIRVRPMFRDWEARGTLTVIDEELSGITEDVLRLILEQAGARVGVCDWRPSSL